MNICLVKTRHPSPPSGNGNTHKKKNGSQCSTDAVAAGSATAAVVVPRFARASKDCAATRPRGKAKKNSGGTLVVPHGRPQVPQVRV